MKIHPRQAEPVQNRRFQYGKRHRGEPVAFWGLGCYSFMAQRLRRWYQGSFTLA